MGVRELVRCLLRALPICQNSSPLPVKNREQVPALPNMQTDRPVVKCICFNVPFSVLKDSCLASIDEIKEQFGCTGGCGMCAKYIELMLETGEIEFPILWGPEFAAWKKERLE